MQKIGGLPLVKIGLPDNLDVFLKFFEIVINLTSAESDIFKRSEHSNEC